RRYVNNPDEVLNRTIPKSESSLILGNTLTVKTGMDQIKEEVSKEFIRQVSDVGPSGIIPRKEVLSQLRSMSKDWYKDGSIIKSDLQNMDRMINQQMFDEAGNHLRHSEEKAIRAVSELFTSSDEISKEFQSSIKQMSKEVAPIWSKDPNSDYVNLINSDYLAVNKANVFEKVKSLDGIKDLLKQTSLLTGRRNMEDVTTLSIYGSYFPAYRLQKALNSLNLGLSDESMATPLQTWGALFMKRGLPIVGGLAAFEYGNYQFDQLTGAGIDKRWENYKAENRLDEARARDEADINDKLKKKLMLRPGYEHLDAMPSATLPFFGEVGPGVAVSKAANLFFGYAPLNDKEAMTEEETYDDI